MAYRRRRNGTIYHLTDAEEAKVAGQGSYQGVRARFWMTGAKEWSGEFDCSELDAQDEVLTCPPGNIPPSDGEPRYRLVEVNGPEGRYTKLVSA